MKTKSTKIITEQKTFLGYELSSKQNAIINFLVPSVSACVLYIFLIACDIAVTYKHFKNKDPIWANLTLFFMYLPTLGSYIIIVSNWELWPTIDETSRENTVWFLTKTTEHLFFPIWNMWRFAERIFWSIEAIRAKTEKDVNKAISITTSPRSIELYIFLQSYLHALPQILLQMHVLMRHNADINRETEKAQIGSIILNLTKLSMTTVYYQRFKSQKLCGRQYPWYKYYKALIQTPVLPGYIIHEKRNTSSLECTYDLQPPKCVEHRRSSDIYLEPSTSAESNIRQTLLETDFGTCIETRQKIDISNGDNHNEGIRETSVIDGPMRSLYRQTEISEPDFNISRVIHVKGLLDDDLAGKIVAFFWWFSFLLARILTMSTFAYFYIKPTVWLMMCHFIVTIGFLLYDVKSDQVKRSKAIFFLFIGFIYIFCIIEFKIKFKKANFIYYGFFALVYFENFIMCITIIIVKVEYIENDFWFRYIFYIIVLCSITSISSMMFYLMINKPPKIVVAKTMINERA